MIVRKKRTAAPIHHAHKSSHTVLTDLPVHWSGGKKQDLCQKTPSSSRHLWDVFSGLVDRPVVDQIAERVAPLPPLPPYHGDQAPLNLVPFDLGSFNLFPKDGDTKHYRGHRRLKKQTPGRTLDLHGFRIHETSQALWFFLHKSQLSNCTVVRVITGKSLKRQQTPGDFQGHRLRDFVPALLNTPPFSDLVRFYQIAPLSDGGDGVLYIHLKKGPFKNP